MSWEWGEGAITAKAVRYLPDGTDVYLHYKDRYGVHRRRLYTVVLGTGKFLYDRSDPEKPYKAIRCTKNQYFTLVGDD